MNNKGFSLIELLAVITILGIIIGIAVVSYNKVVNSSREQVYKSFEDTMKAETEMYLIKHSELIPSIGSSVTINLSDLNISQFVNPTNKNDSCPNSKVIVTRGNNVENNINLNYQVCLICSDYKTSNTCS